MTGRLAFVPLLASESDRFLEVVLTAGPDASVPSCPQWTANDLLWHLGMVQWFWATIVRERLADPRRAEESKPERPNDRAGIAKIFRQATDALRETLAATPPTTPVWTWSADQSVRFVLRRQAHEALIHRVDAELTASTPSLIDAALASDGVDEVLHVMYGGAPVWGHIDDAHGPTVRVRAVDTDASWHLTLGRFTGTDPDTGTAYDEPALAVAAADRGGPASAEFYATAADLDCWLWRRPTKRPISRSGEPEVISAFEAMIESGIQ